MLMLVLGLRRGEALGLLWSDVNLDTGELDVAWQLQRSGRQHPRVAMRILHHSKIAVTMEIYTEVPDDTTRDALRRLGDQLDG